jgi:hypothetical protein
MSIQAHHMQVYEELADWYDRQCQAKLRDWFLVLAADAAVALGRKAEAERLRQRLLHVNPHHLLKPFSSFAEALNSADVRGYIADLRSTYPPESAAQLLHSTHQQKASDQEPEPPLEKEPELKVFRGKEAQPPPPAKKPDPSPAAPKIPLPVAWTRPDLPAALRRPRPEAGSEPTPPEGVESPGTLDRWLPLVLFFLMLAVGTALAFYSLVWPLFMAK